VGKTIYGVHPCVLIDYSTNIHLVSLNRGKGIQTYETTLRWALPITRVIIDTAGYWLEFVPLDGSSSTPEEYLPDTYLATLIQVH